MDTTNLRPSSNIEDRRSFGIKRLAPSLKTMSDTRPKITVEMHDQIKPIDPALSEKKQRPITSLSDRDE